MNFLRLKFLFISVIALITMHISVYAMEEQTDFDDLCDEKQSKNWRKSIDLEEYINLEKSEKRDQSKKSDTFVITVLSNLINQKIQKAKLKKPKKLGEALKQLNYLYDNIQNIQFDGKFEFEDKSKNFELTLHKNGILLSELEIPSTDTIFHFWTDCAVQKVLQEHEKIRELINFIVQKIATNVTEDNKEKFRQLVDTLPQIFSEKVQTLLAHTYGWQDKSLNQKQIPSSYVHELFPLGPMRVGSKSKNCIKIWNTETGECENELNHKDHVSAIAYNNENILASTYEKTITLWNIQTGECENKFKGHTGPIYTLLFMDNHILVSASWNGIAIWDVTIGEHLQYISEFIGVLPLLIKLDTRTMVSASDSTIKIWNMSGVSSALQCLKTINQGAYSLLPLKDKKFVSISSNGTINLWDINGNHLKTFKKKFNELSDALSINNTTLASSYKNKVKIWDLQTGKCKKTLERHQYPIKDLTSLHNTTLVSLSHEKSFDIYEIALWNAKTGNCLRAFGLSGFTTLALTDDALVCYNNNILRIIDAPTFEQTINFLAQQNSKEKETIVSTVKEEGKKKTKSKKAKLLLGLKKFVKKKK